ncbi:MULTISPECIES: hypothetical protein [Nonomuraea]|uniref:Uncharacterized protein n=2 Tax=Nonomuraea TaxID=83681 RepID=A0ABW1BXA1_9ACTN|nr:MULTISPECIES: hypothetical protein [Nonomuraea]MDA0641454.1 hypothetical protein [Nonomuraea ferruginea]TXK38461.1 hypothetical protein FR742_01770 [Nonomuraea sp. C10]
MGYELRVVRESPIALADLAKAIEPAGFELRGSEEIVARHGDGAHAVGAWRGQVVGEPGSDWQVAQLVRLSAALGARLVGEDGEVYALRDGAVEVLAEGLATELGRLDEMLRAGPAAWTP